MCILKELNGIETPPLEGAPQIALIQLQTQFERDRQEYQRKCEQNRENGMKGGRPSKTERFSENPTVIFKTEKTQDKKRKEEEKKKIRQDKREREPPPAPTLEEVKAYAAEIGYSDKAEKFFEHYTGKGWPRNWKSKIREWKADEYHTASRPNPAHDYEQRQYTEADFSDDFFIDLEALAAEEDAT